MGSGRKRPLNAFVESDDEDQEPLIAKKKKAVPKTNDTTTARLDGVNDLSELDRGLYMDKKSTEAEAVLNFLKQETKSTREEFMESSSKRARAQEQLAAAQAKFSLAHAHFVRAGDRENSAAEALQKAETKPGARFKPNLAGFREFQAAVMELETPK